MERETLARFVELAGERLSGDWVILGGAVVPLLGGRHRATLDIDVVGPEDSGQAATNELLQIALDLGLPVEAINQSGAFFLRAVSKWRDELDVIHRGARATIHVPNATLYVLLKLERLSESDLDDCVAMLKLARKSGRSIDRKRLHDDIDAQLGGDPSPPRRKRLDSLGTAIGAVRR